MKSWKCPCCACNNPPHIEVPENRICPNCKNKFSSENYIFESESYTGSDVGWQNSEEWWGLYNKNRDRYYREKTRQEIEESKNQTVLEWLKFIYDMAQATAILLSPFIILTILIFIIVKMVKWFWIL
jgi:hypothetical protein